MAIRPPARRRGSGRRQERRLPDEVIGLIAGTLLTAVLMRILLRAAGVEPWTTSWRVVNTLTLPVVWPFEQIGLDSPELVGTLIPSDLIAGTLTVVIALYLLAARAIATHRN